MTLILKHDHDMAKMYLQKLLPKMDRQTERRTNTHRYGHNESITCPHMREVKKCTHLIFSQAFNQKEAKEVAEQVRLVSHRPFFAGLTLTFIN